VLAATGALAAQSLEWRPSWTGSRRRALGILAALAAAIVVALLILRAAGVVSWAGFFVLAVPLLVAPAGVWFGWLTEPGTMAPVRRTLRVFGLAAAATFIGLLTLLPTVWLPLRAVTVTGAPVELKGRTLEGQFAAFVLSRDEEGTSLLVDDPRGVVHVAPKQIDDELPLCVPPESSIRALTVRASQVLGIDPDPHSPYPLCPGYEP